MKIVTWNVNSLKARSEFLAKYLDKEKPDVIGIQELKLDSTEVPTALFTDRGYFVAMHTQKTWNGVLLAARSPPEDVERGFPEDDGEARLVAATVDGIRFVNLYCPQGQSVASPRYTYKLKFYDGLVAWAGSRIRPDTSLVVMGDMNVAPEPEDIFDPIGFQNEPCFTPPEHERWRKLVGVGLTDAVKPHLKDVRYSYWDYRAGCFHKNQGMRIDHILVTEPVLARVETAWIDRNERKKKEGLLPSDHAPVVVSLR
jgi:exodeoxyribonuclease III